MNEPSQRMTPWEEFHHYHSFVAAAMRIGRELHYLQIQEMIKWRPRGFVMRGRLAEIFQGRRIKR